MKILHRAAALFLTLLMLCQLFPAAALATGSAEYQAPSAFHSVTFGDKTYLVEDGYTIREFPEPPAEEGRAFLGWYDGDTLVTAPFTPTKDVRLTAKFEEINLSEQTLVASADDGSLISLTGVLPEGCVLTVTDEAESPYRRLLMKSRGGPDLSEMKLYTYNIQLTSAAGQEYQPETGPVTVTVQGRKFTDALATGRSIRLVHEVDENNREEITGLQVSGNTVSFQVSHFSRFIFTGVYDLVDWGSSLATDSGVGVSLSGVMPNGATAAALSAAPAVEEGAVLAAADITLYNSDVKVQPSAWGGKIQVTMISEEVANTLRQKSPITVYHIDDEGNQTPLADEDVTINEEIYTVSFEADAFSVYAIVGDTNAKYVFHNADGTEYSFVNKNGDSTTFQQVPVGGTLYNPGTPATTGEHNLLFWGWFTKNGNEWGDLVIPANVESVNPDLSGLQEGVSTTIDLYARFEETYYLVYHDETMTNILATEAISSNQNVTLKDEHGDYRVQCILSGEDATNKAVLGWGIQPHETTDDDVIEEPFNFDGGMLDLYPVIADAFWISFDKNDWKFTPNEKHSGAYDLVNGEYVPNEDNTGEYDRAGTGASYVAPRFVLRGERYNERYSDVPSSNRPGYEFRGWYYDKGFTQPFNPATAPTSNVTVYAKWEAQTVPYTVQYWLQNANGDGYTLADVELKLWEGTTGTDTAVTPDALTKTVNDQGQIVDGPAVKDKYDHYKLHVADPADDHTIQNEEIAGDGSTVINVYYDCQMYTLRFIYARSNRNGQYQITEDVSAFTTNNRSRSWSSLQSDSSGSFGMTWQNVTGKPPVNMKDDSYVLGSFSHGNYTYYYLDVTGLKYGQVISDVWPYNSLQPVRKSNSSNNYGFVSWGVQYGSPYWNSKYDEWSHSSASNKNGLFTIKGAYNNLDDLILNDVNNATLLPNGDLLAHVLFGRYKTSWNEFNYLIYVDPLEGETGVRNYNGELYVLYKIIEDATSTATLQEQAVLAFEGLRFVAGPFNSNNQKTEATGGDVYYYYKRIEYDLNIFRNHEGDTYTEEGPTYSTQKVKFGQNIKGYLENSSKNHLLNYSEYVVGETTYEAASGEEFVFTGWYSNPEGLGDPVDFTNLEMTENKFIYAGWRPKRYRVWIQPNGGELSSTESTWFNVDYGETVGNYSDITRDYLRDPEGEYIYVIYDHEVPRTAQYVKLTDATDDQIAHALRDGGNYIRYKYMKNAYTFVGWYQVLGEEFGTYEQYYANGNSNDGIYTVRPPTINESDTLSSGTYVFGTPVDEDIALRAIWKRSGTIAVEFDPHMEGTELTGTVPTEYAARETSGDHAGQYILHYGADGKPDQWSADPTDAQRIYPLTEQVYADLSNEKATYAPDPPENYYFVGWKTPYGTIVEPNDIFTLYVDLAELMGEGADGDPWYRYKLTAVYAKLDDVELTYHPNGGTGTLTDYGSQSGNDSMITGNNQVKNLILNNPITLSDGTGFTRDGYILVGWSKKPGDNYPFDYELGDDNVFIDDNNKGIEPSILYAVWLPMALDVSVYKYGQQQTGADAPLPGASFGLNGYSLLNFNPTTAVSQQNGLVQFTDIIVPGTTSGTVVLKETALPAGTNYQLITEDIVVTYEPDYDADGNYQYEFVGIIPCISAKITNITCSRAGVLTREDINSDGTDEWVIHNKLPVVDINLEKFVSGNMADMSKEFSFTVTAKDSNNVPVSFSIDETAYTSGTATGITLKHGDTKKITLPIGAALTVTEDPDGYTPSITSTTTSGTAGSGKTSYSLTAAVADDGKTITFTNDKTITVDTGIQLDTIPYFLILALCALGLEALRRRRVKGGM